MVNHYGYCMLSKLYITVLQVRFLDEPEKNRFSVCQVDGDRPTGYVLEVDFVYSTKLHDVHSDFPWASQLMRCCHNTIRIRTFEVEYP